MLNPSERPTFYLKNGNEVRAVGALFKTKYLGETKILFRHTLDSIEDIGGKTDYKDNNLYDTVIREVTEETNGKLFCKRHNYSKCSKLLRSIFRKQRPRSIYSFKSKYLLFIVNLDSWIYKKNMNRFGKIEKHSRQKHKFKWENELPDKESLNFRLQIIYDRIKDNLN